MSRAYSVCIPPHVRAAARSRAYSVCIPLHVRAAARPRAYSVCIPLRVRAAAAFTLIEVVAVVAIFALVASVVLPGLRTGGGRPLRLQAERLAADLELARNRSQLLGVPHRVWIDLDAGAWRTEWLVTEAEARGETPPEAAANEAEPASLRERLDLSPPLGEAPEFRPVPTGFGQASVLDEGLRIARIETTEGPLQQGAAGIVFEVDGSSEPLLLVLSDDDGRSIALQIEALEEEVHVQETE